MTRLGDLLDFGQLFNESTKNNLYGLCRCPSGPIRFLNTFFQSAPFLIWYEPQLAEASQ